MTLHSDPAKVAKQIMPAGTERERTYARVGPEYTNNFNWRKSHGRAGGRMIDRAVEKAMALGFVPGKFGNHAVPDGNYIGNTGVYSHPDGWELTTSATYGNVAYDNSFSMRLRKVAVVAVSA